MKIIELTCNHCNAQLEIDLDNLQAYCPYCGQKLLLSLDQMDRVLIEKEQTKREKEKTRRAEEATKRVQMEYEYNDKKDRRDHAASKNSMIVLVLLFVVLLFICLISENISKRNHQINNDIQVSTSSEDLKGESLENAVAILKNFGFENVNTKNKEDLILGLFSKEGEIDSISINGNSSFTAGDWFPADAIVIVTYHGFSED